MIYFKRLSIWLTAIIFPLIFTQTTFACLRTPGEVPFCYIYRQRRLCS